MANRAFQIGQNGYCKTLLSVLDWLIELVGKRLSALWNIHDIGDDV